MSPHDRLRPGALALAFLVSALATAQAQTQQKVIYVSALDAQGKPVASLEAADLRVREDGNAREILKVSPATDPLQIALLVDNSQAMERHTANFRDALTAFVARFPAPHQVALITLGERPTIVTEYTSSGEILTRDIDRLFPRPGAGAYVLDGIGEAARGLQKREALRSAIVVLATNGVEFSSRSYEPVLDALKASGAALYVVTIQPGGTTEAELRNEEYRSREIVYDRGPTESGGRRQILLSSMAAKDAMTALADELLAQFAVVYARPTTLIPPERVKVEAVRPGLQVRGTPARSAPRADPPSKPGPGPAGGQR